MNPTSSVIRNLKTCKFFKPLPLEAEWETALWLKLEEGKKDRIKTVTTIVYDKIQQTEKLHFPFALSKNADWKNTNCNAKQSR